MSELQDLADQAISLNSQIEAMTQELKTLRAQFVAMANDAPQRVLSSGAGYISIGKTRSSEYRVSTRDIDTLDEESEAILRQLGIIKTQTVVTIDAEVNVEDVKSALIKMYSGSDVIVEHKVTEEPSHINRLTELQREKLLKKGFVFLKEKTPFVRIIK